MSTRKEILEGLLLETAELRSSLGDNTEAAHGLRDELDRLQTDVVDASRELAATTERSIELLSDRLENLRDELAEVLSVGAKKMGKEIFKGHLVGQIVGQVAELNPNEHAVGRMVANSYNPAGRVRLQSSEASRGWIQ
jgi:small ligand-binding sensory domain FIST